AFDMAGPEHLNTRTPEHPTEVLDLLTRLIEKSLVIYEEAAGEGRYRLLEMIREYAGARLAESGEGAALARQHARFFMELAETAEPELRGADRDRWLDRLDREHHNLRAALEWCVKEGESDQCLVETPALSGAKVGTTLSEP